jgi:hypothetical protein
MDFTTFNICVAALQVVAVHVMTPEQFEVFTKSIKDMREDACPPKAIVRYLTEAVHDAQKITV